MTREEAISIMKVIVHMLEEKYDTDRVEDAVDMAIKALEQEPCEDCISREEVCDYIAEFVNHEYATDREREMVKHIIGGIQHLPSIQPTVKENLVVEDCISRAELLKAIDTWDKFGVDDTNSLFRLDNLSLPHYVPYIHYDDVVKAIKGMPSIQPKTDEPMQVELEGDGYADGELVYDYGKCPKCGWDFEYGDKDWEESYCCHCGQKLHWFESKNEE